MKRCAATAVMRSRCWALFSPDSPLSAIADLLDAAIPQLGMVENEINSRSTVLGEVNLTHQQILGMATGLVKAVKEQLLGTFDLFPPQFGIANTSNFSFSPQLLNANTSNFSFSASSGPNWYCFEAKDGAFLCRPLDGTPGASQDPQYEIIRLTTTVTPRLSSILFAQGIKGLLSVTTQEQHEAPSFDPGPGSVQFNRNPGSKFLKGLASDGTSVYNVPVSDTLDFHGASGIYYEELFFHAPFLIAQTLNTAQKFEEAKMWYEFIFDPTQVGSPWNYLPFRTTTEDGHFLIDQNQIKRYLDDPFDPHAIAALRPTAYQKAIVMSYIDNLLDWGDMLFRQYTAESIDEARMLYTLASDLLGEQARRPGHHGAFAS